MNNVIVEFFGLPGIGKSTVSHELASLLSSKKIEVVEETRNIDVKKKPFYRQSIKILFAIKNIISNPSVRFRLIVEQLGVDQKNIKSKIKLIVNYLYICQIYENCESKNGVKIIDQGLLQAAWSLLVEKGDDRDIENIKSHLKEDIKKIKKNSYIIINLEADERLIVERINKRINGKSRMDTLTNEKELIKSIVRGKEVEEIICQKVGEYKNIESVESIKLIRVLNEGGGASKQISKKLLEIMKYQEEYNYN